MPAKGQKNSELHNLEVELGSLHRELNSILRLSNPTEKKKQKAIGIGKQIQEMNKRKAELKAALEHLTECYMVMYPDDPGKHCTCMDWSPDV